MSFPIYNRFLTQIEKNHMMAKSKKIKHSDGTITSTTEKIESTPLANQIQKEGNEREDDDELPNRRENDD